MIKTKAKKKPFFLTEDVLIRKHLLSFKENRKEILIPPKRYKDLKVIFKDNLAVPENIMRILTDWSRNILKYVRK